MAVFTGAGFIGAVLGGSVRFVSALSFRAGRLSFRAGWLSFREG